MPNKDRFYSEAIELERVLVHESVNWKQTIATALRAAEERGKAEMVGILHEVFYHANTANKENIAGNQFTCAEHCKHILSIINASLDRLKGKV